MRKDHLAALAGALTVGAGLVHAAAAGTHTGESTLVAMFAATAVVQVGLGFAVILRPSRLTLAAVAVAGVATSAFWVLSRTTGVPIDGLTEPETVGRPDLLAAAMQASAALAALVAVARSERAAGPALSPLCALVLIPAMAGMTAPHVHDEGHEAAHEHLAGHSHVEADLAADPIFAGADTSHASESQLEDAKALIERTRAAVASQLPDRAALEAAGYHSIGDGFPFTQFQHFVNDSYLSDGREVDAGHIESIVLDSRGQVVSAMYILEPGKTMADAPDIADGLTLWHDHQDLCWDESGTRLAGVLENGRCFPGGTLKATPPMLHVWLSDQACGPFAGIEGHGPVCSAGHHSH